MEPKNYSTIRSILKRHQGEKIAPYVFKVSDTKAIQEYLDKKELPTKFINYMPVLIILIKA